MSIFDQLRAHSNKGVVAAVFILLSILGISEVTETPPVEPPPEEPVVFSITVDQCKAIARTGLTADERRAGIRKCNADADENGIVAIEDKPAFCERLAHAAFDSSSDRLLELFKAECTE